MSVEELQDTVARSWQKADGRGGTTRLQTGGFRKQLQPQLYLRLASAVSSYLAEIEARRSSTSAPKRRPDESVQRPSNTSSKVGRDTDSVESGPLVDLSSVRLAPNQDASMPILEARIESGRTDGVDLIEYAGLTTLPLIRAIGRASRPLRLLLKHPDTTEGVQQQRMIATLDTLYTAILPSYTQPWEVRCYRLPYSLRARRIGTEFLEIGWLTPDPRRRTAHGHDNPSLLIDLTASAGVLFLSFFDRTFADLWDDDSTEIGADVFTRFSQ
ncbi:MAG TPA: hypothetical protein VFF79_18235 [Conexibacter sp.]|nr:hypothetical protein [Conexibacter sp.]